MIGREWKPGDVQVVLSLHPSRVQEFACWLERASAEDSLVAKVAGQIKAQGHGARLVVIDPEDDEQVQRLADAIGLEAQRGYAGHLLRALRGHANPTRPSEPGEWGVVEASCCHSPARLLWIHHPDGTWVPFFGADGAGHHNLKPQPDCWDDLVDPVVIREGVTHG